MTEQAKDIASNICKYIKTNEILLSIVTFVICNVLLLISKNIRNLWRFLFRGIIKLIKKILYCILKVKTFFSSSAYINNNLDIQISSEKPIRVNIKHQNPFIAIVFIVQNKNKINLILDRLIINIDLIIKSLHLAPPIRHPFVQNSILKKCLVASETEKEIEFRCFLTKDQSQFFKDFRDGRSVKITIEIETFTYFYANLLATLLQREFLKYKELPENEFILDR